MTRLAHTASVRAWLALCRLSERLERSEAETEHAMNELAWEWEHITHTVPLVAASVRGWLA